MITLVQGDLEAGLTGRSALGHWSLHSSVLVLKCAGPSFASSLLNLVLSIWWTTENTRTLPRASETHCLHLIVMVMTLDPYLYPGTYHPGSPCIIIFEPLAYLHLLNKKATMAPVPQFLYLCNRVPVTKSLLQLQ